MTKNRVDINNLYASANVSMNDGTLFKKKIKTENARKIKFKQKNLINMNSVQVLFFYALGNKKKNGASISYSQG